MPDIGVWRSLVHVVSLCFATLYVQVSATQTEIRGDLRGKPAMAKYVVFFTYSSETWARMIQSPGDRTAALRQLADSVGGSVECLYWMFALLGRNVKFLLTGTFVARWRMLWLAWRCLMSPHGSSNEPGVNLCLLDPA
jgi:hypothetical protein